MPDSDAHETILHASCIAHNGRAVLITGGSGSGKSTLALQCLALGATLVADDRTRLFLRNGALMAEAPDTIRGLIEARGVGILSAPSETARVGLAVDLDMEEPDRLPPRREFGIMGQSVPLLWRVNGPHFAAALLQLLKHGRKE